MFTAAAQIKEIKTTIQYCQRNLLQRILCLQKRYGRQFFDDRPKLHGHLFLHLRVYMYQAWNALHTLLCFSGDSNVIGITSLPIPKI